MGRHRGRTPRNSGGQTMTPTTATQVPTVARLVAAHTRGWCDVGELTGPRNARLRWSIMQAIGADVPRGSSGINALEAALFAWLEIPIRDISRARARNWTAAILRHYATAKNPE